VIPPEANAAFVAGMEDVLEVYHRPHDPARPVVCLDETSKQLIKETRVPMPVRPSRLPSFSTLEMLRRFGPTPYQIGECCGMGGHHGRGHGGTA
jgi:hypothetical protein